AGARRARRPAAVGHCAARPRVEAALRSAGLLGSLRPPPRRTEAARRGGRAVEGARLESVYGGNSIAGSNPAPSAIAKLRWSDADGRIGNRIEAEEGLSPHPLGCRLKEGEQGFTRPETPNAIVALVCG